MMPFVAKPTLSSGETKMTLRLDDLALDEKEKQNPVTYEAANELCRLIYERLSGAGIYPALTGGLLYKEGARKDIDIVLYRNRQQLQAFEIKDLEIFLKVIGIEITGHYGFVTKGIWNGFVVDLFNPETQEGEEYE